MKGTENIPAASKSCWPLADTTSALTDSLPTQATHSKPLCRVGGVVEIRVKSAAIPVSSV